jgi:hypothetical protein
MLKPIVSKFTLVFYRKKYKMQVLVWSTGALPVATGTAGLTKRPLSI